jgi:hypothetical protein
LGNLLDPWVGGFASNRGTSETPVPRLLAKLPEVMTGMKSKHHNSAHCQLLRAAARNTAARNAVWSICVGLMLDAVALNKLLKNYFADVS